MRPYFLISVLIFVTLVYLSLPDTPQQTWAHSGLGTVVASLSKDGKKAIIATVDNGTQYWDLENNKMLFKVSHSKVHETNPTAATISLDETLAATTNEDTLIIWDLETGDSLRYWQLPGTPSSLALSSTGKYALVGFVDGRARIYNIVNGDTVREFQHEDTVTAVSISEDGRYALLGSEDTSVRLWDLEAGLLKHEWFHKHKVTHVDISPDNKYVLTSASQSTSFIRDVKTGETVSQLLPRFADINLYNSSKFTISSSRFINGGRRLITGSPPKYIRLWDIESGQVQKKWTIPDRYYWKPTSSIILDLSLSEDNQSIIAQTSNGMGYRFLID